MITISKQTVSVLKNFANINGSILIKEGNQIATVSPARNIFARYTAEETFPVNIPLYDLNDLIASLSLFESAEVDFKAKHMVINGDNQKMKYVYSPENTVSEAPSISEDLLSNPKVTFDINQESIAKLLRAASVVGGNVISFIKKGDTTTVVAHDRHNPDANRYEITLNDVDYDGDFSVLVLVENVKTLPLDFTVSMYDNFVRLSNNDLGIEYVIATESDSTWS